MDSAADPYASAKVAAHDSRLATGLCNNCSASITATALGAAGMRLSSSDGMSPRAGVEKHATIVMTSNARELSSRDFMVKCLLLASDVFRLPSHTSLKRPAIGSGHVLGDSSVSLSHVSVKDGQIDNRRIVAFPPA